MSLIQVRKKGAQPAEGVIAKYNIPQTGAALLEALALRVGAGDLEDAHGVSVTKADTSVAAGEYIFTPGVPPIFRIEDLRPVGHLALDTPNSSHSNGGLQSLADLVPNKIAKTSTGGFHNAPTSAAHQSSHQPSSGGGIPGASNAANTSSGIAAMGLPLSWQAYSSPNLQLAGVGRGDPRLQGGDGDPDALGLSSDPNGHLMGSDMNPQMGVLRKGKGYGGAGGQKRCKWCTERAGYDVSKSKHLCVQFMESMGRSDLAQEARLDKRPGWDHDADGNKIKLEPSSQSHQQGSEMQQMNNTSQQQQQLHSSQDLQSHLHPLSMSHPMDHPGSMPHPQQLTAIHMSHHHPPQQQPPQPQQSHQPTFSTISSPTPQHQDRAAHGTPTSAHHHAHHSAPHQRHHNHDLHASVISSPIT